MGLRKRKPRPALGVSRQWIMDLLEIYFRGRIRGVLPGQLTPWHHHWETELEWDEERQIWTAHIEPGFCESSAPDPRPHYRTQARHAPAVTRERLGLSVESDELVEVPLTEEPAIDLPAELWRPLGTEGVGTADQPAEAVPQVFRNLGVADPILLRETAGGVEQVIGGDLAERGQARLLRAMDIVLSHERARTAPAFTLERSGSVSVEMDFLPPLEPVRHARIHRRSKYEPRPDFTPLGFLRGTAVDAGVDEIHLATVYLLSERGLPEGSPIDEKWVPFARHFEWWPLQYRERYQKERIEPTRLDFDGAGLGLGTLDDLADRMEDGLNERIAELEAQFNTAKAEGRFFSA